MERRQACSSAIERRWDFNGDGKDDFVVGAMGLYSREPHNYEEFVPERYVIYLSGDDGKLRDGGDGIQGRKRGLCRYGLAHDSDGRPTPTGMLISGWQINFLKTMEPVVFPSFKSY